ncbi:hypothetical protein [Pannonibacter sp. SL95]|uniref:hypothetical protein n=1 Tax=Pannonibacter sp. SL95 TaxID=2995153 RepID=UPI00227659E4|nr:hypothetical protein [Pannonibacter sp. SL95]MCY1705957.1 hypothetical protein [Pannonibacter sp. SL95]
MRRHTVTYQLVSPRVGPLVGLVCGLLLLLLAAAPVAAETPVPNVITLGPYQFVNTAGFSTDAAGKRTEMPTDLGSVEVFVDMTPNRDTLILGFESMRLQLQRLPKGLAALDWSSSSTITLRREDILTLTGKATLEAVETFATRLDWPGIGPATLVMFEAGGGSFAGFLISKPGGRTVVRQMEAHRYFASRPRAARGR